MKPRENRPIFHKLGVSGLAGVGGGGLQFMVWCAVIVFASTYSFLGRQERRATGTSTYWVCFNSLLSASLLMAFGGESGAAGVWVLKKSKDLSDGTSGIQISGLNYLSN